MGGHYKIGGIEDVCREISYIILGKKLKNFKIITTFVEKNYGY